MYGNPYYNAYNAYSNQSSIDKINNQITELEKMKQQLNQPTQQQPSINQTFQLAPNGQNGIRYANTIDDVKNEHIVADTPFFSRDMSILWVKDVNSNIKTYTLTEIIPQDNKDMMIQSLQLQIEDLKKEMRENATTINANADDTVESTKSSSVSRGRKTTTTK